MEKTIFERREEFFEETVKFYTEDPTRRAVNSNGGCKYRTDDGRKCAIGRHIPDEQYYPAMDNADKSIWGGSVYSLLSNGSPFIGCIPLEVRELGTSFLAAVQDFHDMPEYWNKNGLTEEGIEASNGVRSYYSK